jgi:hypothetical protein
MVLSEKLEYLEIKAIFLEEASVGIYVISLSSRNK